MNIHVDCKKMLRRGDAPSKHPLMFCLLRSYFGFSGALLVGVGCGQPFTVASETTDRHPSADQGYQLIECQQDFLFEYDNTLRTWLQIPSIDEMLMAPSSVSETELSARSSLENTLVCYDTLVRLREGQMEPCVTQSDAGRRRVIDLKSDPEVAKAITSLEAKLIEYRNFLAIYKGDQGDKDIDAGVVDGSVPPPSSSNDQDASPSPPHFPIIVDASTIDGGEAGAVWITDASVVDASQVPDPLSIDAPSLTPDASDSKPKRCSDELINEFRRVVNEHNTLIQEFDSCKSPQTFNSVMALKIKSIPVTRSGDALKMNMEDEQGCLWPDDIVDPHAILRDAYRRLVSSADELGRKIRK